MKFVKHIFKNDPDTLCEFGKFMGLALSNRRNHKMAFMFYGGSNTGKTSMLNLLNMLFDPECKANLSFSQLTNDSTICELTGKHICLTSSIAGMGGRNSQRMETFKSLVGNDMISVKQRDGSYTSLRNRCLLVFACSSLPEIADIYQVESWVSDLIIFPFKHEFKREDWKDEAWLEAARDTVGIVKFAIAGLKTLALSNYEFRESKAMKMAKEEFQGNLESFTLFAKKYIKRSKEGKLTSSEIHRMYMLFCESREFPVLKINQWPAILKKMFHTSGSIITKNGKRDRGYSGIAFRKKIIDLDMNMEYEDEEDTFAAEIDDILTENQTDDEWEDEEELELDESLFENPTDDDPDDDETED